MKFRSALERSPPNIDLFQTAVYTIASSDYSPYSNANDVWGLDWEEFVSSLEWVQMNSAAETAAHLDAAIQSK